MTKITTSQFQKGIFIEFRGEPNQIVEFQHVNPGKGSAFIRTKLKSLKSGKIQEFTYKSGETVEEIPIEIYEMQYLYKDMDNIIFMNQRNFEQYTLKKDLAGNFSLYMKEGEAYQILTYDNQPLGIRPPKKVKLKVAQAEEGSKGNTVVGARKKVKLETGVEITVPLFIKKGDLIAVDPETGQYLERISQKT